MPDVHELAEPINIDHAGGDWALARPEMFSPYNRPTRYATTAYLIASEGTTLKARIVEWRDQDKTWHRFPAVTINPTPGQPTEGHISHTGWTHRAGLGIFVDVWADKPDHVQVRPTTHVWPVG